MRHLQIEFKPVENRKNHSRTVIIVKRRSKKKRNIALGGWGWRRGPTTPEFPLNKRRKKQQHGLKALDNA